MRFFFADDSKQKKPTRQGMGPLVAIGGVMVSHREMDGLQDDIEAACKKAGFPTGEPFKWSRGSELWMYKDLKDAAREKFFRSVLKAASDHKVRALVVIEDTSMQTATKAKTHELDVTTMFLERADMQFSSAGTKGIVVADRPGGGMKQHEAFLSDCLDTLRVGTKFWKKKDTLLVASSTVQVAAAASTSRPRDELHRRSRQRGVDLVTGDVQVITRPIGCLTGDKVIWSLLGGLGCDFSG